MNVSVVSDIINKLNAIIVIRKTGVKITNVSYFLSRVGGS